MSYELGMDSGFQTQGRFSEGKSPFSYLLCVLCYKLFVSAEVEPPQDYEKAETFCLGLKIQN